MPGPASGAALRSVARLALATLLLLPLSSCDSAPSVVDPTPVGRELAVLKSSQNSLYYQPFLRGETAGPESNSFATLIRSEISDTVPLHPDAQRSAFFRSEAISVSPLIGRAWLIPLATAGAKGLLNSSDATAVRRLRTPGGWFKDPGTASADDTETNRVAGTLAALQVLQAQGGVSAADRAATLPWLRATAASHTALDGTAGQLALSLRLLGSPVPEALTALRAPSVADFGSLTGSQRYQALTGSYAYALIQRSAAPGGAAKLDPAAWTQVLAHNADTLGYADLYDTVVVAHAAGAAAAAFDPVRARLAADTLPDGSVRDPDAYIGDPEASLYVLLLRGLAKEPTTDPALVTALGTAESDPHVSGDPVAKLITDATRSLGGDRQATAQASADCRATGVVPADVTVESVETWGRLTRACHAIGLSVPVPSSTPWGLADAQHVTAAATLVTGLTDAGLAGRRPGWITAAALLPWAEHPERLPSSRSYAIVVRAYLAIAGDRADPAVSSIVHRNIDARRGCPGFPDLYQADSADGCDLVTTWTVWRLLLDLDGRLPLDSDHPTSD
jgi:hypothetical protein